MEEKISEENLKKIQELQILEQNLQNLIMQKQAFQFEENDIITALEEMKSSGDEVYKIVGQVMIKSSKQTLEKELKSKKEIIELRLKNIEKQESALKERALKLREDVLKELKH
jgi:prefoldin beta subunit